MKILVTAFTNGDVFVVGEDAETQLWLETGQTYARRNLYSPGYSIKVARWPEFRNLRADINVRFADVQHSIAIVKWNNAPDYKVEIEGTSQQHFALYVHSKCTASPTASIPSARFVSQKQEYAKYSLNLSDSVALLSFLEAEYQKGNRRSEWDKPALDYARSQLEAKQKRDGIVVDGKADFIGNPFAVCCPSAEGAQMKLKPYQQVAIAFAEISDGNIINADEVGLGKTLDAIGYAVRNNLRTLFITKASLAANLKREIMKLTGLTPLVMRGTIPSQADMRTLLLDKNQFVIINYTILSKEVTSGKDVDGTEIKTQQWVDLINLVCNAAKKEPNKVRGFDLIVADEAHAIKNMESARSKAVRALAQNAPRRMALTATPVVNGVGDYFPLLNFIDPVTFNNYTGFLNTYTVDGRYPRNEAQLKDLLKSYLIRRSKRDVMKDLDPINRMSQYYELSEEARKRYDKAEAGVYEVLKTFDPSKHGSEFQINGILAMLIRLKQIVSEDKIQFTGDLAREINDSARDNNDDHTKVIIFSQFVPVVRSLAGYLGSNVGEALFLTGEDHPSADDKMRVVDKFMSDKRAQFLVCSTAAASEGLNITAAGTVIFNDLMWTPAAHEQAEGRAYGRLSDPHPISSYYILGEDTVDDLIYQILHRKWKIIDNVVEGVERDRVKGVSVGGELIRALKERMG